MVWCCMATLRFARQTGSIWGDLVAIAVRGKRLTESYRGNTNHSSVAWARFSKVYQKFQRWSPYTGKVAVLHHFFITRRRKGSATFRRRISNICTTLSSWLIWHSFARTFVRGGWVCGEKWLNNLLCFLARTGLCRFGWFSNTLQIVLPAELISFG